MFDYGFRDHPNLSPENRAAWNLTFALKEFCRARGYHAYQSEFTSILASIERNDRATAIITARSIPVGGMGCFNDVFIQPLGTTENWLTEQICFDALLYCWQLELLKPE